MRIHKGCRTCESMNLPIHKSKPRPSAASASPFRHRDHPYKPLKVTGRLLVWGTPTQMVGDSHLRTHLTLTGKFKAETRSHLRLRFAFHFNTPFHLQCVEECHCTRKCECQKQSRICDSIGHFMYRHSSCIMKGTSLQARQPIAVLMGGPICLSWPR